MRPADILSAVVWEWRITNPLAAQTESLCPREHATLITGNRTSIGTPCIIARIGPKRAGCGVHHRINLTRSFSGMAVQPAGRETGFSRCGKKINEQAPVLPGL